jgi:serine/threonine protein kinase
MDVQSLPTQAWDSASGLPGIDLPRLDRYVPQRELGKGGFASVYLANDTVLNRLVALKIPHEKFSDRQDILQEARVAASLRHPGIVAVLDVVKAGENRWFIVSEYVEGETLSQVIRKGGRLPITQVVRLMVKVARGLHFAHKNGFVHRDIKPGNILIRKDGEPFVSDFGIAVHEDSQHRFRGDVSGTPYYMAPEQIRGQAHHLDGRTDEWAFGCVLYELLTSQRPFHGKPKHLREEICEREPKPLRQRNDAIPRELEEICLKCLSKNVAGRYPTMLDVADALEKWLETHQTPNSLPASAVKPRRTKRGWLMIGSSAAVLLIALATALALSNRRAIDYQVPIEKSATVGRWYDLPLPGVLPREVAFTKNFDLGRWQFFADTQSLVLDSRTDGMIGLGITSSRNYQIQIQMSKAVWGPSSYCGLFLGWKPGKLEDGSDGYWFQSVGLEIWDDKRSFITRGLMHLKSTKSGVHFVGGHKFKDAQIEISPVHDILLEVDVRDGQIFGVKCQGRALWQLTNLQIGNVPELPDCTGEFGVGNSRGSTRFHNCRFMLTKKNSS